MKSQLKEVPGGIVAAQGFLASGVFCDIKRLGTGKGSDKGRKPDLALIVSEEPATVAGTFTTNQVCAAPVKVCVSRCRSGTAQAIVVNSGNANACTGRQGVLDARAMTQQVAGALSLAESEVLVASTGRIGVPLPMTNVRRGIRHAVAELDCTVEHGSAAAEAIMTSDTRLKQVAVEVRLGGRTVRLGGIAKGAGMIHPGMSRDGRRPAVTPGGAKQATMLAFVTTDAAIDDRALQVALENSVAISFNRITVDGDMSTNDTVLVLANGMAGNPVLSRTAVRADAAAGRSQGRPLTGRARDAVVFQEALDYVCLELAKMMVRDGEGVHRVVTVQVGGARTAAEADAAARSVANSTLVKTSWHGGDPNWGRIMDALGYSPARVDENRVDIGYGKSSSRRIVWSLRRGRPTRVTFETLCAAVAPAEFELHINLNLGRGAATLYAADLTEAYVEFNKGDVTDPGSLEG